MTVHRHGPGRPRDPGRQPERTRLAWRRTMLTVTAVALLAVRLGLPDPADRALDRALDPALDPAGAVRLLAAAGVLLVWLAMLAVSGRRIAGLAAIEPVPAGRAVPLTALAALGLVGLGLVLVLVTAR